MELVICKNKKNKFSVIYGICYFFVIDIVVFKKDNLIFITRLMI